MKAIRAAAIFTGLSLVWLKLLPMWATTPGMRSVLERQERAGINGGAIYYTENPAALEAVASIREIHADAPDVFWSVRASASPPITD